MPLPDLESLHAIRPAGAADMSSMLAILNAVTESGHNSLDDRAWSEQQLVDLVWGHSPAHFVLVHELAGQVVGWAAIIPHHEREAYRPSVELMVYVHPSHERRGIGAALASTALEHARREGFHLTVSFTLEVDGAASRLAQRLGFEAAGALREVIFLRGAWMDLRVLYHRLAATESV